MPPIIINKGNAQKAVVGRNVQAGAKAQSRYKPKAKHSSYRKESGNDKLRNRQARIRPLGESHLKRSKVINQGIALYNVLGSTTRTFTFADVPAMLEDDQIALGIDYLKIPVAQAPIMVKTTMPEAYGYACDLYQRIWDALIAKIDLALAYGEECYEPIYRKDRQNSLLWDFHDFDIAPPMSSVPWTVRDKLAFVAVHGDGVTNSAYFSYWYDTENIDNAEILEGAGKMRPTKALWVCNDPLTSRWFGRTVLRAPHMRWKAKNMPDGGMESLVKAFYKSAFSGLYLEYPANTSVVAEDGSVITSEQFADLLLQVLKTGSNVRLPAAIEGQPAWKIIEYAKNLIDMGKLIMPLDYWDRGMMRGMGVPDDILNQSEKGGYSRSLVSIDAFYSRGEARARQYLPRVTEDIVNPLLRQRWGMQCEASAYILRAPRPGDPTQGGGGQPGQQPGDFGDDQQQDEEQPQDGTQDALEGAMNSQYQRPQQPPQPPGIQNQQSRFSLLMSRVRDREIRSREVKFDENGDDLEDETRFAVRHAQKGGEVVGTMQYKGGQFLPIIAGEPRPEVAQDAIDIIKRKFGEYLGHDPYLWTDYHSTRSRDMTDEEYKEYKKGVKKLVPNARVTRQRGVVNVSPPREDVWFHPWDANLILEYMRQRGILHSYHNHAHPDVRRIEKFRTIKIDPSGPHYRYLDNYRDYGEFIEHSIMMRSLLADKVKGRTLETSRKELEKYTSPKEGDKIKEMAKAHIDRMIETYRNGTMSEKVEQYRSVMHKTIDKMTAPMVHRFVENVMDIILYKDCIELSGSVNVHGASGLCAGAWSWDRRTGRGSLNLDGGYYPSYNTPFFEKMTDKAKADLEESDQADIYAHEFGHAIDSDPDKGSANGFFYSSSPEWQEAANEEIMKDKLVRINSTDSMQPRLTAYAKTNMWESWAEYLRLVINEPAKAEKDFPKCWSFLKNQGLI